MAREQRRLVKRNGGESVNAQRQSVLVKTAPAAQDKSSGELPPPHPALVELVRLLARAEARRARAEGGGTQS